VTDVNSELAAKLKNILSKLDELVKTLNISQSFIAEYRELLKSLESTRLPSALSRDVFSKYFSLYRKLSDVERAMNKSGLTLEDINSLLTELKIELSSYIKLISSARRREALTFALPVYMALAVFIFSGLVYLLVLKNYTMLAAEIVLASIAAITLLIRRVSIMYSYIILIACGALNVVATLHLGSKSVHDEYNLMLSLMIILFSGMNMQIYRTIRSRNYQSRMQSVFENLRQIATSLDKSGETEEAEASQLERHATELFKKLYGEEGDKLLSYKLNVLVMHGYKRTDALKKILSSSS